MAIQREYLSPSANKEKMHKPNKGSQKTMKSLLKTNF